MWPTVTIYTASASLSLLSSILNGVAAICKQNDYIWGFAVMAALYHLVAAPMATALHGPSGQGGAVLTKSISSPVVALLLAFALTTPGLKGPVQVESTINGKVSVVANVPVIISIMPAAASLLSNDLGTLVSTAYQSAGTNYSALSSQQNGFVNPLKALLGARYAVMGLGQIDSEVKTVIDACLGSDAGIDYAALNQSIMNAGNSTGATTAQTVSINGVSGTALGALLFWASQNTTGLVNNLDSNQSVVYSCPDAVTKVTTDISSDLQSTDFSRATQSAINSMDQPLPGTDFSLNNLQTQYNALINADSVNQANVYGIGQAQQELYNLMFSSLVNTDLSCLQANGSDKTGCYATMEQVQATERNNIQAAAAEQPMLEYAGNLANYMLALIIGLGPILVLFMMLAGVDAGKSARVAVHIMVWPLLVMNVGAEIINGMICIQLSDFYITLRQSGVITQAETYTAYQELSMQIGAASNLMASLPVLMSMIFGLSATASLVSVANKNVPDMGKSAADLAPTASVTKGHSVASYDMLPNGSVNYIPTGSQPLAASSVQISSLQTAGSALHHAQTEQHTISAATNNLSSWRRAMTTGNYSGLGIDASTGNEVRQAFLENQRVSEHSDVGHNVAGNRSNTTNSGATFGASGSLGFSFKKGVTGSVGISGSTSTGTSATDSLQASTSASHSRAVDESKDLSKAINDVLAKHKTWRSGSDSRNELQRSYDIQKSYQDLISTTDTSTSTADRAVSESQNFLGLQQHMDASTVVNQLATNRGYSAFQSTDGIRFDADPFNKQYLNQAEQQMNSPGETNRIMRNDRANHVLARIRAATLLANDQKAPTDKRLEALQFLYAGTNAMYGRTVLSPAKLPDPVNGSPDIRPPVDPTLPAHSKPTTPSGHHDQHGHVHHNHGHVHHNHGHVHHNHGHVHHAHVGAPHHHAPSGVPDTTGDTGQAIATGATQLASDAAHIRQAQHDSDQVANQAGLGDSGPGTIIRTAQNVKDNARIRKGGSDRTHFGPPKD